MFSTFNATGSVLVCGSKAIIPPTLASYYATAYSSYQTPNYNATTKTWNDSSPNARHKTFSTGSPTIVSSAGINGTSNTFNVVNSIGDAKLNFGNPDMMNYTFFAVARELSTNGYGIFMNTVVQTNLFGFWYFFTSMCSPTGSGGVDGPKNYSTNFFEITVNTTQFRTNGYNNVPIPIASQNKLVANFGISNGGSAKPWQIAEMILFDSTLSATDTTTIEGLLRTKYGITTL